MPRIITHIRPHLDDICAAWLLKRYLPECHESEVSFIPVDDPNPTDERDYYVGVKRGRFDEHKGDLDECAASLVWRHIKQVAPPEDFLERAATEKLVDWVRLDDTGLLMKLDLREFAVPSILMYRFRINGGDSADLAQFGFQILDALIEAQKNQIRLAEDWESRIEFQSIYGPAVAIMTSARFVEEHAYARGFNLVVFINRDRDFHNVRASANSDIDLEPVYKQIKAIEPDADWFLHHSHKLVICGGDYTGHARKSRLTLEWLVDMLTPNYLRAEQASSE